MPRSCGPIVLDPSFIPDEKWDTEMTFEYTPKLAKAGVDCRRERFAWVPALHTFLGGIRINDRCETGVPGLFAAGESSTGTHGSNRLSGNAIASALALGTRAGRNATHFALGNDAGRIDEGEVRGAIDRMESLRGRHGVEPSEVEAEIRQIAWEHLGVVRTEQGLQEARRKLETLR